MCDFHYFCILGCFFIHLNIIRQVRQLSFRIFLNRSTTMLNNGFNVKLNGPRKSHTSFCPHEKQGSMQPGTPSPSLGKIRHRSETKIMIVMAFPKSMLGLARLSGSYFGHIDFWPRLHFVVPAKILSIVCGKRIYITSCWKINKFIYSFDVKW